MKVDKGSSADEMIGQVLQIVNEMKVTPSKDNTMLTAWVVRCLRGIFMAVSRLSI
jgi:hypothetical protein